jgi:hypothetical protein
MAGLRTLDLGSNGIGREGALALASSPHRVGLSWLELWGNPIGAAAERALRARFGSRVSRLR